MGVGKFFGTHLGDLGSRSLSYQSGMQFTLSPRWSENRSSNRYKTGQVYFLHHAFHLIKFWEKFCKKRFFSLNFKSSIPNRTIYLPYLRNGWSNSDIWQSLSLRYWRWKAVVTLGWMGATFGGSGSWPPQSTANATLRIPERLMRK